MGTVDIQAAINSIPAKKEDLRKAFEELESYSSSFASFTLRWKDIDGHFSSVEKSIDKKYQEIKAKVAPEKPTASVSAGNVKVDQYKPVIERHPELKSLCVKMDAKGLRWYIARHGKVIDAMRRELGSALLCSLDPVKLVLDSFEGFVPSRGMAGGEGHSIRRAYLFILECFHGLKLEVKPSDKERAWRVAKECYDLRINRKKEHTVVVMVFLHLIVRFGLFEYFAIDDILNLLVTISKKRIIIDLCRNSALEEKMPDLIDKLNSEGLQLHSVKFVLAFNLQHMFPPKSLFEAYINQSNDALKGSNSAQLEDKAISKQICALKQVKKAVGEHNLGSQYPCESLENRIQQLEKQKLENKRLSAFPGNQKQQQHQPPNKRPRPSDSSAALLSPQPRSQTQPEPLPLNSAPAVLLHAPSPNQPPLGLVGHSPYMANSYGLITAPSVYNPIGLGDPLAPPRPAYIYASVASACFQRPVAYGGYPNSGFPPYNPSPYP